MRFLILAGSLFLALGLIACKPQAPAQVVPVMELTPVELLNTKFDPERNPQEDLQTAMAAAQEGGKRIILDVGGEWCPWCHILDGFVEKDEEIKNLRDASYVWMKVNYSEENTNAEFLSHYPAIKGYPHLFVLDAQGNLLQSQFTGELESGRSYDREKFLAFMRRWAQ